MQKQKWDEESLELQSKSSSEEISSNKNIYENHYKHLESSQSDNKSEKEAEPQKQQEIEYSFSEDDKNEDKDDLKNMLSNNEHTYQDKLMGKIENESSFFSINHNSLLGGESSTYLESPKFGGFKNKQVGLKRPRQLDENEINSFKKILFEMINDENKKIFERLNE